MEIANFLLDNWIQIGLWVGSIVAYIFDRNRRKLETENQEGTVLSQIRENYRGLVEDNKQALEDMRKKQDENDLRIAELENLVEKYKEKLESYERHIQELEIKLKKYERE